MGFKGMFVKQRLAAAAKETYGRPLNVSESAPLTVNAELARDALAEIERLEKRVHDLNNDLTMAMLK